MTPSTRKNDAETLPAPTCSGSPAPVSVSRVPTARRCCRRPAGVAPIEEVGRRDDVVISPSRGRLSQTITSSSGFRVGSSRSSTAWTTLKMAPLAPMPSARVIAARAVNQGSLRASDPRSASPATCRSSCHLVVVLDEPGRLRVVRSARRRARARRSVRRAPGARLVFAGTVGQRLPIAVVEVLHELGDDFFGSAAIAAAAKRLSHVLTPIRHVRFP